MLPHELVLHISRELDVASLCELSQTSAAWRYALSEEVFRAKMSSLCPWFEPRDDSTWKACAFEYIWRLRFKNFAPRLKFCPEGKTKKSEKNKSKSDSAFSRLLNKLKTSGSSSASSDLSDEPLESSLQSVSRAELFNKKLNPEQISKLLSISQSPSKPSVYTSKYGIQVSFANVDVWSAPDFQEILSLPQLLAVLIIYQDVTTMIRGILVVKYADSPGLEPDVNLSLHVCQKYRLVVSGKHIFVHIIDEIEPEGDIHYGGFFYVTNNSLELLFTCTKPVVCYNGLFYFFSRRKLNCIQVTLGSEPVYAQAERPLKIKYCLYVGLEDVVFLGTKKQDRQLLWNMSSNEVTVLKDHISSPQRFGVHSAKYACDDEPPFYNASAPGVNCLDLEDAEASGEDPETPVMKPFALVVSLGYLGVGGESIELY